jgi:hypothetical protein
MSIIFPSFNEPFPQRKVEVRIRDENEKSGFAILIAVQINTNIAASIYRGSLELLQIEETDIEDVVNLISSTPPFVSGIHEGLYWESLLKHANTLTVAEFIQKHRHLIFQ